MTAGGSATDRRRAKAALFLLVCSLAGLVPHWLESPFRLLPASLVALVLGGHSLRTLVSRSPERAITGFADPGVAAAVAAEADDRPGVDVVVAARDEQAVISRLVEGIARLRWPQDRLRLWVVDDGSEDRTPELLSSLARRHPIVRVLRRPRDAGGGKSGALNGVLPQLEGRWMLVLDADADLQPDVLERLIPHAEAGGWAAVQLRKAVTNAADNLLTRAQALEMVLDTVVQQGRLAIGGIVELRGNGQLLRRDALLRAGGFNEATVTDDLDLSFRFLVEGLPIGVLWDPPVREEAVLLPAALWRQRQRWAEGGLQRFFDYGLRLVSAERSPAQRFDLLAFLLLQYALPVLVVADLAGALITRSLPLSWPFSLVTLLLSGLGILIGCRRPSEGPPLPAASPFNLLLTMLYLLHWCVVIPWVTLRMAVLPKRLVWAKTLHLGLGVSSDDPAAGLLVSDVDESEQADLATGSGQA